MASEAEKGYQKGLERIAKDLGVSAHNEKTPRKIEIVANPPIDPYFEEKFNGSMVYIGLVHGEMQNNNPDYNKLKKGFPGFVADSAYTGKLIPDLQDIAGMISGSNLYAVLSGFRSEKAFLYATTPASADPEKRLSASRIVSKYIEKVVEYHGQNTASKRESAEQLRSGFMAYRRSLGILGQEQAGMALLNTLEEKIKVRRSV